MLGSVFDAGDGELVDDVAGDSDDEEVAEALVEQDFGAESAICAGDDYGLRSLALGDIESGFDSLVGVVFETLGEPGVAFDDAAEGIFGVGVELFGNDGVAGLGGGFGADLCVQQGELQSNGEACDHRIFSYDCYRLLGVLFFRGRNCVFYDSSGANFCVEPLL